MRLTSGTADSDSEELTNAGIVGICVNDTFGRVCNTGWTNRDASVVCRELGFSPYGINLYVWQLQTFTTILGYQSKIAGSGPDHNTWISSLNSCFNRTLPTMFLYGQVAGSSVCPIFSVLRL